MKNFTLPLLCFLTLILSPLSAQYCGWWSNYYATFVGGANFKPEVPSTYEEFKVKTSYSPGYILSAAIGSRIGPFRMEGEFAARRNTLHKLKIEEFKVKLKGNLRTITGMANIYYDFDRFTWFVTPYVGIGLGYANTRMKHHRFQAAAFNGNDKGFAWQAIAGLTVPLIRSPCPPLYRHIDLVIEYRYLDTHLRHDYNHSVGAGLRCWF